MANPGLSTTIDVNQLTGIIVFGNSMSKLVEENANTIQTICKNMEEDESLKGGDGDNIREAFATLAQGCQNLKKSMDKITKVLNVSLDGAIKMRHGTTAGLSSAEDSAKKASRDVGVLKKE